MDQILVNYCFVFDKCSLIFFSITLFSLILAISTMLIPSKEIQSLFFFLNLVVFIILTINYQYVIYLFNQILFLIPENLHEQQDLFFIVQNVINLKTWVEILYKINILCEICGFLIVIIDFLIL